MTPPFASGCIAAGARRLAPPTPPLSSPACQSPPHHPKSGREEAFGGFMSLFRNFQLGATFAVALAFSILPTVGHAYTPEEQQACQPDAFRLCSSEIPDVDRVTACMVAKKSQLSPQCRAFFRSGPEPS